MTTIKFNIVTLHGLKIVQEGELIECNGHQYALHYYRETYRATLLSIGFCVVSVDKHIKKMDSIPVRDWLIKRIKELGVPEDKFNLAKDIIIKARGLSFPINPIFGIKNKPFNPEDTILVQPEKVAPT